MAFTRILCCCAVLVASLSAQTGVPFFTRESVLPVWGKRAQSLMPNDLIAIYGRNLARAEGCPSVPPAPYPTELCGTQVTVAGIRAGLLAVLDSQINFQVPADAPDSGEAAILVTVAGVRSRPVMVPFGKPKVVLSLAAPAYVHMPVWIQVERPNSSSVIRYPYALAPWNFGGNRIEVKHNGILLKPQAPSLLDGMYVMTGLLNGTMAPAGSPSGRLPLHLQYRFDVPGQYEIRFTGTRIEVEPGAGMRTVQVDASDWTEITVGPFSGAQRRAWVQEQAANMPSSPGLLIGDAIPSLLAVPDELVLPAILPRLYHSDELVRRYVAASVTMFDEKLLRNELTRLVRQKGPTEEIARILDGKEELFEGGHAAILAILPAFINSASPSAQAGALQYLEWGQNHPWGKTPEYRKQFQETILAAASNVLQHGNARSQQMLAMALGLIQSDDSRELLWKMIDRGMSAEQSQIALTWIGDTRDLPRLATLLLEADPGDPLGRARASSAYSIHRAYGEAALPYLDRAARDGKQFFVRTACAKELALANRPEGFRYLMQALDERPSFQAEVAQFMRDRFPELRGASSEAALALLRSKAALP